MTTATTQTQEKWDVLPATKFTTLEDHEANDRSFELDELVADHGDGGGHPTIGFVAPEHSERIARLPAMERALLALVDTVNATGGLFHPRDWDDAEPDEALFPRGDPDWQDLAEAYLLACEALDREPVIDGAHDPGDHWELLDEPHEP